MSHAGIKMQGPDAWAARGGHRSINEWSTGKKAKCALFYLDHLGTIRACQKPISPSIRMSPNSEADTYL